MALDLAALVDGARSTGEAFYPVLSQDGSRVGISARQEGASILLDMEVQLRLVPPNTDVDIDDLSRKLNALTDLAKLGFGLHHFEHGWVVATAGVNANDLAAMMEAAERIVLAAH
jgi:translation elongation factor EF-1beta